jgi:aspartyl-tRNA(Asn)/glutamyl-tRNA(Gln) amidotransferase subunit B
VERQGALLARGESVQQETRHWDERRGVTFASRVKEEAQDYRYFPEPDLVPIVVVPSRVADLRAGLPELPEAKQARYVSDYGLSEHDAALLTSSAAMAKFFEETVRLYAQPKTVCNWLIGDVTGYLNAAGKEIDQVPISPAHLAELLTLIDQGTISGRTAKEILGEMLQGGQRPSALVAARGVAQISDERELAAIIDAVVAEHPQPAADFKKGKASALTFLVGQVMKKSRGRANPDVATRLLKEHLSR